MNLPNLKVIDAIIKSIPNRCNPSTNATIYLMVIIKKFLFAFPFLLTFAAFSFQFNPFLQSPSLLLSFNFVLLTQVIGLLLTLTLSIIFFIIFATLASDRKLVLPVAFLVSLMSLFFIGRPAIFILVAGSLISFGLNYFLLENKLKNYLSFQPTKLLIPSIKQTINLIILFMAFAFYTAADTEIKLNGFKLPASLIDTALNLTPDMELPEIETDNKLIPPTIPPEQLQLLKQNPQIFKQFNLDPTILNELEIPAPAKNSKPTALSTQNLIKPILEKQMQAFLDPYIQYIPIILAAIFFFTLQSFASLLSILLSPLIWVIFKILEEIGFIKFVTESRPVKKMVI